MYLPPLETVKNAKVHALFAKLLTGQWSPFLIIIRRGHRLGCLIDQMKTIRFPVPYSTV